jgi:hypothetical protein
VETEGAEYEAGLNIVKYRHNKKIPPAEEFFLFSPFMQYFTVTLKVLSSEMDQARK